MSEFIYEVTHEVSRFICWANVASSLVNDFISTESLE